jgi:hypothetical protein
MNIDPTLRWRNVPKPTIAAVQGYCIFAGWMIASACDVVIAADDAMFLPTNFQYFSVPWDLHPRKAKAILFESRFVDAKEAEELDFVSWVVPKERLQEEVMGSRARRRNDPFTPDDQARHQPGAGRAGVHRAHLRRSRLTCFRPRAKRTWTTRWGSLKASAGRYPTRLRNYEKRRERLGGQ